MDLLNIWKYLLFLGLYIQFSNGYPRDVSFNINSEITSSHDFDMIVFVQSWPETVCFDWQEQAESNQCSMPEKGEWSIHGLWPTKYHQAGPNNCNKMLQFDPTLLQQIREELEIKWINVHDGEDPELFWEYEWTKHGTCAISLNSLNSEEKYFEKSLELFDKYNMKNILDEANIFPGEEYPVQDILDGVNTVLGVESMVVCLKDPKTDEQYIQEIRICFDKQLTLINCNGVVNFPTNCDDSINVTY